MSGWITYGIYVISGILILFSILVAGLPPIRDLKTFAAGVISLGVAIFAIISVSWLPIIAGILIIMLAEGAFRPRPKSPLVQPWSLELTPEREKEIEKNAREERRKVDALVDEFFECDMPPPTPEVMLQPCEWLPGLKAPLVVGLPLLKDIVDNKKRDRDSGILSGGSQHQRVAVEVLFRWFNTPAVERDDGSHLVLPDQLTIMFAPQITTLLSNRITRYACKDCCLWHKIVQDRSERGDASLVHSTGVTRFTCPEDHVVYEQPYHLRIHRDLE